MFEATTIAAMASTAGSNAFDISALRAQTKRGGSARAATPLRASAQGRGWRAPDPRYLRRDPEPSAQQVTEPRMSRLRFDDPEG